MKRFLFITMACALASIPAAFAQGEMDAFKYSRNDLTGSARAMGMGGAFGALGGDVTGVAINPAGLGVYRSSEIVTTLSFNNNSAKTDLNAGSISKNKFTVDFDNLAFVGALPIDSDIAPLLNFSFAYNKLKNFDRKYSMRGQGLGNSLTDYMAYRANEYGSPNLIMASNPFRNGADWLGALGYHTNVIQYNGNGFETILDEGEKVNNNLFVHEKGEISSFDFSVGTTFADMLSLGLSLSVTDINYHLFSNYGEAFENNGGLYLDNWLKTEGTGFQVSLGAIYKPIHELRIGLAYHSPTWYQMTDYYSAVAGSYGLEDGKITEVDTYNEAGNTYVDYDFRTPDRWTISLAGVLGQSAIISLDYELTNYKSSMRFRNTERLYELEDQNAYIEQDFRNASTLRVGAEYRFTPRFTGRLGYAWMQSPLQDKFKNNEVEAMTVGTIPHFTLEGDTNYFTWGFGYRFTPNFYGDVAFVIKSQKDNLYSYSRVNFYDEDGAFIDPLDSTPAKLTNNLFSGLITLGYRF